MKRITYIELKFDCNIEESELEEDEKRKEKELL